MARFRSTSTMMSFPPFSGVTSRLVAVNVAIFFLLLLMQYAARAAFFSALELFSLIPALFFRGWIWQPLSYSFLHDGVLHIAFNMLTLWFIGSYLESARGSRWLLEIYFAAAIGGGVLGSLFTLTHLFHANPGASFIGSDAAIFGLLAAFGALFGDLEIYMFPLPLSIKARYLVIVYMLIEVAFLFSGGPAPALACSTILGGALIGFLFSTRAPKRGASFAAGEKLYGLRNSYYRWKRRRAARKFEVYMRKRNRDVRFDGEGRYIDPDDSRRPKGPNGSGDRKWMN